MARTRCSKCGLVYDDLDFPFRNKRKATPQKYCNSCKKTYWKEYYEANKDRLLRHRREKLLYYQEKSGTHPKRPWQVSEIGYLYENQGKLTILQMAEKLGRSWQAVQSKLKRLNGGVNQVDSLQWDREIFKGEPRLVSDEHSGNFKKLTVKEDE